jgi:hypothetical protein
MRDRRTSDHGTKGWQREDEPCPECGCVEDRSQIYREWRTKVGWDDDKTLDVDQIEWRILPNGRVRPVAVLEITRRDWDEGLPLDPPQSYLEDVLKRFKSDLQSMTTWIVAEALGVGAFLVVFKKELDGFYVYDLLRDRGFNRKLSPQEYVTWLKGMD